MTSLSMYERAMGEHFASLPSAVQRFHRLTGHHVLQGRVETQAPKTPLAKLLAICLGSPRQAVQGSLRFELDAKPEVESWTRHFPGRTMSSQLRLVGREMDGQIEERLGAARLRFDLQADDGRLSMRLIRLRFLGIPCPTFLIPGIVAEETGSGEHFNFRVQVRLPLIGLVADYRGHLQLSEEGAA
ncbi:MAG TPA: DUF4166 domain-containing protein [Burkholderiaceae bacterium]